MRFDVDKQQVVTKNVVGVLTGTAHPDEWVLYTSHWDHMGVGEPDATGDTIFNGAADNAAGVSQLLEIARNFAAARRPQRSLGFIFVTAEERGLLGSEYYATSPLYPLATTVAVFNTDFTHVGRTLTGFLHVGQRTDHAAGSAGADGQREG